MEIDDPAILAEVRAAFARYERALVGNDLAELDLLFWDSARTVRYGAAENLRGIEAIRAFRGGRPAGDLARALEETVITTFGADLATASTLFRRGSAPGRVGRQMQTWVRVGPAASPAGGWRIVAAHVSVIPDPAG